MFVSALVHGSKVVTRLLLSRLLRTVPWYLSSSAQRKAIGCRSVRETHFLCALSHLRTIVFPRQARDKHQEMLKNQGLSAGDQWWNNAAETGVPTVTFEGGGGSGAEANVIVEESDPTFFQTIKQTLETRCEIGLFLSSSSS